MKGKVFLNLIKFFVFISCFVAFFVLMMNVWKKFSSNMTSTGVTFRDDGKPDKLRPLFTVCAWPVYKTKGFHFKVEEFDKNTFEMKEIFENSTLSTWINDSSKFSWQTVRSVIYGRCYTIKIKVTI